MADTAYCSSCIKPISGRVLTYRRSNWCEACFLRETGGPLPPSDEDLAKERREREAADAAVRQATETRLASVRADVERRRKQRNAIREAIRESASGLLPDDVLLSTTPDVPGYRVVYSLDVLASERVLGVGLLGDVFSAVRDIVGGSDRSTTSNFARARMDCLQDLRCQAAAIGATAVIGVSLDYGELSAQGKSGVYIGASGTAVVVEPIATVETVPTAGKHVHTAI